MKHLLLAIPLILLFLLDACGNDPSTITISDTQWAAMRQTETAQAWTAIPTQTFNANIPTMVSWLNSDLFTTNSLGATMDADYSVNNILFQNIPNSSNLLFRVDVGCTCMNSSDCCLPEKTFVMILESMKRHPSLTLTEVPSGVARMIVVCFDHKANSQIGAISASWPDVQGYLLGTVMGPQLGVRVTRTIAP